MKIARTLLVLTVSMLCLNCFAAESQSTQSNNQCAEVNCAKCSPDDESCKECCGQTDTTSTNSSSSSSKNNNDTVGGYDGSKD